MKLGYCCINLSLNQNSKIKVSTNRSLIKRTFSMEKASELARQNVKDLKTILEWNVKNSIFSYRISSEMFPRISETNYEIESLLDAKEIIKDLQDIGKFIKQNDIQISFHPGPFNCLGSPNPQVIEKTIIDLECHNKICNLIGSDLWFPINFHVGGSYGQKYEETSERFCNNFQKLSKSLRERVVIENDDKANGWSCHRLFELIHKKIDIPITLDLHHSIFSKSPDVSIEEEFELVSPTWKNKPQMLHYSESANKLKDIPKHSDYLEKDLPDWLKQKSNIFIELECKAKDLALLKWRKKFKL